MKRMEKETELKLEQRQEKVNEEYDRLVENGHDCIVLIETYPSKIQWCKDEKSCKENPQPLFLLKDLPLFIIIEEDNYDADTEETPLPKTETKLERLRHSNCKNLSVNSQIWKNMIYSYRCDFCDEMCDPLNPIYTNPDVVDRDLCSNCVFKITKTLGVQEKYNLEKIRDLLDSES